jgi:crossover junction endodeoxyribonuclease RuvC
MKVLAFDFGCRTGWASCCDGQVESGVQDFPLARGESPGMRFLRFRAWMSGIVNLVRPEICIYELAHHRGGYATELLVGMITRLQEHCAISHIEYSPVHSATLKKFATGSGRADKAKMLGEAKKRFPGRQITDDNEADALLLLAYGMEHFKEAAGE